MSGASEEIYVRAYDPVTDELFQFRESRAYAALRFNAVIGSPWYQELSDTPFPCLPMLPRQIGLR